MDDSKRVKTLPKSGILFNWPSFDEVQFTTEFLKSALPAYYLDKLSNGHIKREITVVDAHPIAVAETFNTQQGEFQSRLPLIGIEQLSVSPETLMLGANESAAYQVTEDWIAKIEEIPKSNRMFPDEFIQILRSHLAEKQAKNDKLYVFANSMIERTAIQISAYSASSEANRIIKKVLKSLMIEYYRGIQKFGVKPEMYSMQPNLYNFDYGETLYGCELEIPFLMRNTNYIIDIDLTELKHFDIGIYDSNASAYDAEHVAFFRVAGLPDKMRFGNEGVELIPR